MEEDSQEEVNTRDNIFGATLGTMLETVKRFRAEHPDRAYAAIKGLKPLEYADDSRYQKQELALAVNAHIKPCVLRFIALCTTLSGGFKAAQRPPVDINLGFSKWIAACLELMTENPLLHPDNDWKFSLSVTDEGNIYAAFKDAVEEMIRWVNAVRQLAPSVTVSEWQGLVEAVFHALTRGKDVSGNGPIPIDHLEQLIFRQSKGGNLHIDDSTIFTLLGGCNQHGVAKDYEQFAVPEHLVGQVDCGNAAFEYNHYFICCTSDCRMRLTFIFMEELIAAYKRTNEAAIRRAAFTLDDRRNEWMRYYLDEYCQPTMLHLRHVNDPEIVEADFTNNFAALEERFQIACDLVLLDSNRSPEARTMRAAWENLYGKFMLRDRHDSPPSYREQAAFAEELQKFFGLFRLAVDTIGQPPAPEPQPLAPEPDPDPLVIPGGRLARFHERCKWVCDYLEEYRIQLRTAYKSEFEHGITTHLGLPTVENIVAWIKNKHDANATRREIDRVLFDALGTTPSAYAYSRNEGRQRQAEARQNVLSSRALKTGESGQKVKTFAVTKHPDRISPRLIMYWQKLPSDIDFVLLEHRPPVFKGFDTQKYIAGLKCALQ